MQMRFSHIIMMFSNTFLASANRISQKYCDLFANMWRHVLIDQCMNSHNPILDLARL